MMDPNLRLHLLASAFPQEDAHCPEGGCPREACATFPRYLLHVSFSIFLNLFGHVYHYVVFHPNDSPPAQDGRRHSGPGWGKGGDGSLTQ